VTGSLVVHAHFYQPPRENPEFDEVEVEVSATPYHDWNQRVERECYRAVVAARVPGAEGRIARLVNTLEAISFNVGPTLFEWMERRAYRTYEAMLAADRASCTTLDGHGNAIAQPYHHVILPLASRRDKVTEVRWGIADFRRRFGREPEGMWLPETAVDDETLDVLAQEGIRFTVLSPHQVTSAPARGLPGRYTTSAGRQIALCIYDGDISHGIAFGGLVRDANAWWQAIAAAQRRAPADARDRRPTPTGRSPTLVAAATDGETYGHHHGFAEMALARVLDLAREHRVRVENFASFLARHPATEEVELTGPSSWSCSHGVERWRSDCGCRMDGGRNPSQAWRTPLRLALEQLASDLHAGYVTEGSRLFDDPWAARDAYGAVVASAPVERAEAHRAFLGRILRAGLDASDQVRALELLEMERDVLRAFTSCAWFFDDIGGLEVRQVLRYVHRAIRLAGDHGTAAEARLVETLGTARSNDQAVGTGAEVYQALAPRATAAARIAAAARALSDFRVPLDAHLPPGASAIVTDDEVVVRDLRTTRRARYRVVVSAQTAHAVELRADCLDDGESIIVPLQELPERARQAVRAALRNALLPACLTTQELGLLASGDVSLRGLVAMALTRAVGHLSTDRSPSAIALAHAVLDLFEQLETSTPFDAQTVFWHIWRGLGGDDRSPMTALAHRLGFVTVGS
jgi:alpha-amylase/alpha-mannosidase (GH57 family)